MDVLLSLGSGEHLLLLLLTSDDFGEHAKVHHAALLGELERRVESLAAGEKGEVELEAELLLDLGDDLSGSHSLLQLHAVGLSLEVE